MCLCAAAAWLWVRGLQKPRICLKDITVQALGPEHAHLQVELEVTNPNAFSLELRHLRYQLWVAGQELARGRLDPPLRFEAHRTAVVRSAVQVSYVDAARTIFTDEAIQELEYRLVLDAGFSIVGISLPVQVAHTGAIVPLRVPIWRLKALELDEKELGRCNLVFDIRNPGAHDLPIIGVAGHVKYGGQTLLAVDKQQIVSLPAGGSQELVIPVKLNIEATMKLIEGALTDRPRLEFDGRIRLEPVSLVRRSTTRQSAE